MPSPGDCESPLGEVSELPTLQTELQSAAPPTGRTTACTEPPKSAHQECEWKRGISPLSRSSRDTGHPTTGRAG